MSSWWQRRSLAARLAAWFACIGTILLLVFFFAALATGLWQPTERSQLWLAFGVGGVGAAVVFAVAGWLIARRVLTSAKEMVEQARRLSVESLSERLLVANPHDELGQLAAVFNDSRSCFRLVRARRLKGLRLIILICRPEGMLEAVQDGFAKSEPA